MSTIFNNQEYPDTFMGFGPASGSDDHPAFKYMDDNSLYKTKDCNGKTYRTYNLTVFGLICDMLGIEKVIGEFGEVTEELEFSEESEDVEEIILELIPINID